MVPPEGARAAYESNDHGSHEASAMDSGQCQFFRQASLSVAVDDSKPKPAGNLDGVASDNLQRILTFLSMRDRFALMRTQRRFLDHDSLAQEYASYCGHCAQCLNDNPHLCEAKAQLCPRGRSFWPCLFRYCGEWGLTGLRLAKCDQFTGSILLSMNDQVHNACANLRVLELKGCSTLGKQGLSVLASACSKLQELRVCDMQDTDGQVVRQLIKTNASSLRVVELTECQRLTGKDVEGLALCTQLESLSLAGCYNVNNETLIRVVQACTHIKILNLRFCHHVDDYVIATVAAALPGLQHLDLRYCYRLTNACVDAICCNSGALESLNLSQCSKLTDVAMRRIASDLRSLKELHLWGCTKVTVAGVSAISDGLPALTLVDLRGRNEKVIGGRAAIKLFSRPCRRKFAKWEQCDHGIFKRMSLCATAAC